MMRSDLTYRREFNEGMEVPGRPGIGAIVSKLRLCCLYYERRNQEVCSLNPQLVEDRKQVCQVVEMVVRFQKTRRDLME